MSMTGEARLSQSGEKSFASSIGDFQIIGYYSIDGDQNYNADSSSMSYYNAPRSNTVRFDLNQGIESAIPFPEESAGDGSLKHFLEWIARNHDKISGLRRGRWIEPDFVASGGVMTRLLYTAFAPECEWEIHAAKWKGTIYLCRINTESEMSLSKAIPSKYTSWGHKFEQYMVSDHPDTDPNTSRPVVEPAQFRCVFRRRFGCHSVLFTAQVDSVLSNTVLKDPLPLKDLTFVEMKTKKFPQPHQWENIAKHVLLRWWAQSFLTGTDKTLCGWRDAKGIVHVLTTYTLDQMIKMGQGHWDPQTCIHRCNDFLDRVATVVVDECDKAMYKFEKAPNGSIRETKVSSSNGFMSVFIAKMNATGAA